MNGQHSKWKDPTFTHGEDDIFKLKNRLLNVVIYVTTVFALPALISSLLRIKLIGWLPSMYVSIGAYGVILFLGIFARKLNFLLKSILFITAGYLLGTSSFIYMGSIGDGYLYILMISVFSAMLLRRRYGVISIITFLLSYLVVAWLFRKGYLGYSFDVALLANSPILWMQRILTTIFFTAILIITYGRLNTALRETIDKLRANTQDLEEVNLKLTNEIREREQTQAVLVSTEKNFRNIFQSTQDMIVILNNQGMLQEANPAFLRESGILPGSLGHHSLNQFIRSAPDKGLEGAMSEQDPNAVFLEFEFICWNGTTLPVETSYQPVEYQGKPSVMVILRDISSRKKVQKELIQTILDTEEKERNRIAQDIHDGMGPLISAAKIYIQSLKDTTDENKKAMLLQQVDGLLADAARTSREISYNLHPLQLQTGGLKGALQQFITIIQKSDPIGISFTMDDSIRLSQRLELSLFRVIGELINNSLKHSEANTIYIEIACAQNNLTLTYSDNGKGFSLQEVSSPDQLGMGITNIRQRILSFDGQVTIGSEPGKGMSLLAVLPHCL